MPIHIFDAPAQTANDGFGNALAADAERIYIVSQRGDVGLANSGTGYAFDRQTFELVATYTGTQAGAGAKHIQTNGNEVYMGSWPGDVGAVDHAGFAAIYDAATGALKYRIENPTPEDDERFGNWAAPFDGKWLVGAYKSNDQTPTGGAVFGFTDGLLDVTLLDPSIPGGPNPQADRFGYSVGATSDYLLVGAYRDSEIIVGAGAVHVFDHGGNYLRTIDNPEPEKADLFGSSMATKGHHAIVGAFEDDGPTVDDTGSVWLVDLDTGATLLHIENPEPEADDKFGFKVAWLGDNIAVGSWDETEAVGEHRVHVFDGVTGALLDSIIDPEGTAGNFFGFEIAGAGTDLLVGAHVTTVDGLSAVGRAYLYDGSEWLPKAGDANHDGVTNGLDYLTWAREFGGTRVRGPADGDFNYDGITDGLDYLIWASDFDSGPTPIPVPEPGAFILMLLGLLGTLTNGTRCSIQRT